MLTFSFAHPIKFTRTHVRNIPNNQKAKIKTVFTALKLLNNCTKPSETETYFLRWQSG